VRNVRGAIPDIGRWATTAGRYEGATAEGRAVPLGVAHRSRTYEPSGGVIVSGNVHARPCLWKRHQFHRGSHR